MAVHDLAGAFHPFSELTALHSGLPICCIWVIGVYRLEVCESRDALLVIVEANLLTEMTLDWG